MLPLSTGGSMLLKETALVRLLGLRIPMILFVGPRVVSLDAEGCDLEIPLGWRTRNRLIGAMYFGALCVGADLAGGLPAARIMLARHPAMKLVFGDMKAEFLKRADGDVLFRNRDGRRVVEAVERAAATGERVTTQLEVVATVPRRYGDDPVARFAMSLSLKMPKGAPANAGRTAAAGG
jgi:Domain of unknown function (DUF4442)